MTHLTLCGLLAATHVITAMEEASATPSVDLQIASFLETSGILMTYMQQRKDAEDQEFFSQKSSSNSSSASPLTSPREHHSQSRSTSPSSQRSSREINKQHPQYCGYYTREPNQTLPIYENVEISKVRYNLYTINYPENKNNNILTTTTIQIFSLPEDISNDTPTYILVTDNYYKELFTFALPKNSTQEQITPQNDTDDADDDERVSQSESNSHNDDDSMKQTKSAITIIPQDDANNNGTTNQQQASSKEQNPIQQTEVENPITVTAQNFDDSATGNGKSATIDETTELISENKKNENITKKIGDLSNTFDAARKQRQQKTRVLYGKLIGATALTTALIIAILYKYDRLPEAFINALNTVLPQGYTL